MNATCKAFAACVSQPNTPESDLQREVLHDVTVAFSVDGVEHPNRTVVVLATDPVDAIDRVNKAIGLISSS